MRALPRGNTAHGGHPDPHLQRRRPRGGHRRARRPGEAVQKSSLCGLGQTAPNPVLTTIRYFRDEYEAHIKERRCPAGVCKALITYTIDKETCIACGRCRKVCPVDVISGEKKVPHEIDTAGCIRCGNCRDVCPVDAVKVS